MSLATARAPLGDVVRSSSSTSIVDTTLSSGKRKEARISGGSAILSVANAVTGLAINVTGGTLSVTAAGAIPSSTVTFSGGTYAETVDNGISGTSAVTLNTGANVTFARPHTYSGATNIVSGTLKGGAADAFSPNSAVTVMSAKLMAPAPSQSR